MALNFGILQPVNIGGQFMAGQKQAQENQLAQQQASIREQEMGMRQQEMGMRQQEATERTEDRALKLKKAETRNKFLTDLSAKMEKGGHKLNRQTLSSMMNFGLQSNEDSLVKLAGEGLKALDEQDQFQSEMGRFAPAASVTSIAPAVSGALGSGTFDPNAPAPVAPVNALAPAPAPVAASVNAMAAAPTAASVNAMVGGYTRPQIEQMLLSPNTRVRETGKNLLAALPKAAAPVAPSDVSRLIAERNALPPGDPNIATYDAAIRKASTFAPAASTTIKMAPLEGAEQKAKGELNVAQYKDVSAAANLATKTLPSIDTNLNILNKGFETGFGTETVAAGAKLLAAMGVPNAQTFATNAQVFQAKATEAVLQKQLEQKGPQTESDAQRIDQIGSQLGKTTNANKFLLTVAKEQLKSDVDRRNFYDNWWKQKKTYEGAENAWYAGEGGKSLFDRPALKSYIKSTEPTTAAGKPSLDKIFGKRP
jgi:hypothetical protein